MALIILIYSTSDKFLKVFKFTGMLFKTSFSVLESALLEGDTLTPNGIPYGSECMSTLLYFFLPLYLLKSIKWVSLFCLFLGKYLFCSLINSFLCFSSLDNKWSFPLMDPCLFGIKVESNLSASGG